MYRRDKAWEEKMVSAEIIFFLFNSVLVTELFLCRKAAENGHFLFN